MQSKTGRKVIISGLRKIVKDTKASPEVRLRACLKLIELESEPSAASKPESGQPKQETKPDSLLQLLSLVEKPSEQVIPDNTGKDPDTTTETV